MIHLASKILCQLGCHLLWLCGSVVNLLLFTRLPIPAGILRIPVFSIPVAFFSQESRFLFRRNIFGTTSEILSVDFLEREDIRLHDGENEMRGEGGGRMGGGLKLYTKATS